MGKRIAAPKFSSATIKAIADSLPEPRSERKRELLPQILHEWSRTDLPRLLSMFLPRPVIRMRVKRQEKVKRHARDLLQAFNTLDKEDRSDILGQLTWRERNRGVDLSRDDVANYSKSYSKSLNEAPDFLKKLAAISPAQYWNLEPGRFGRRPRNLTAYLVLKDAAAIFEWYSGLKAKREVSRTDGTESGLFFQFVSTLWPVVFAQGNYGLSAAMKNWAAARLKYNERSPLIANMDLRHPTWRIFKD